jgi:hypothetical protein
MPQEFRLKLLVEKHTRRQNHPLILRIQQKKSSACIFSYDPVTGPKAQLSVFLLGRNIPSSTITDPWKLKLSFQSPQRPSTALGLVPVWEALWIERISGAGRASNVGARDVPSCMPSPAARSQTTCAILHSSGCCGYWCRGAAESSSAAAGRTSSESLTETQGRGNEKRQEKKKKTTLS